MNLGMAETTNEFMRSRHKKNLIFMILATVIIVLFNLLAIGSVNAAGEQLGKITGQVVNKENAQPLVGATVMIQGTSLGAITDLDGNFRINKVPAGNYTVVSTSVGFTQVSITEVTVSKDEVTPLNFIMSPEVIQTDGIKVEARAEKNSETVLLHRRRSATAVTDGISAQEMSRSGSGDAAEAMTKVTGASVVDGKFVFVRGLGDRYSNTQLNGSTLPSPDPDKQAVPMDLLPTGLLDNIIVEKSFTPDKPGDFAGGSVNLNTKDYPESRSLVFSTSTGTNSETRLGHDILMHQRSSKDWLGFDDGKRDIPQIITDNSEIQTNLPGSSFEISESGLADSMYIVQYMDSAARAFNPEMTGNKREIPLNQSHSLSYGNQHTLFNNPLGIVASLTYSRKYNSYQGTHGSYSQRAQQFNGSLHKNFDFTDTRGVEEVLWGGLINLKYGFHPNHKIGWNYMYTRNGESETRYLAGDWPEFIDPGSIARNHALWYTERFLKASQFNGAHALFDNKIRADWQISLANTSQEDPDVRFFTDEMGFNTYEDEESGEMIVDTTYTIWPNRFPRPKRLWRNVEESSDEYQLNINIPLSGKAKFKHGLAVSNKRRDVSERRFQYVNDTRYSSYDGDIQAYIEDMGLDTVTTRVFQNQTRYRYRFSNFLREISESRNSYFGEKEIFAAYGMFELPLIWNMHFIGGARYEVTDMQTFSAQNKTMLGKGIDEEDILPSLNLIYRLGDRMNVRAAYSKTLARPNLLEMSSSVIEEFNTGDFYIGNPDLEMTKIDNYDLRWEWFTAPGEIIAVSGFYKRLKNPIENTIINPIHIEVQPRNSDDATIYGFELEYRRNLGFIKETLRNFRLGGNFTMVESKIKLDAEELQESRAIDPLYPETRPMAGQSPYLVNLDLSFNSFQAGTSMSLYYNIFGERLYFNSEGATPDVYEQPRHHLDFVGSQKLIAGTTFKFSVKNILNEKQEYLYDDLDGRMTNQYAYKVYPLGVSYTVGVSYQVW